MTGIEEPGAQAEEKVEWQEIEDAARVVFDVWSGKPELGWARLAWEALDRQRLTHHQDELQRNVVLVRLLALVEVYRDFCAVAWDERTETRFDDAAHDLAFSPFRVGQLVGPEFEPEYDLLTEELVREGIQMLVYDERPRVVQALRKEFAHTDELFVGLILSNTDLSGKRWEDLDEEVLHEVLNNVSDDKLAAYAWIDQGMPVSR